MKRIVIMRVGFTEFGSVVDATRKFDELGIGLDKVEVTLVHDEGIPTCGQRPVFCVSHKWRRKN